MKNIHKSLIFLVLCAFVLCVAPACNKAGCPANEEAHVEFDPNKPFKKNKTKSGLISPKQRKKSRAIRGK